jgi:hypothetical protein
MCYVLFHMVRDGQKFDFGLCINGITSSMLKTTLCSVVVLDMDREECDLYLDIIISSSRCITQSLAIQPTETQLTNSIQPFLIFHYVFRSYILTIIR